MQGVDTLVGEEGEHLTEHSTELALLGINSIGCQARQHLFFPLARVQGHRLMLPTLQRLGMHVVEHPEGSSVSILLAQF